MELYHVLIIKKSSGDDDEERLIDLSLEELNAKILTPYKDGDILFINGTSIAPNEIGRIHIRKTNESYNSISDRLYHKEKQKRQSNTNVINLTPYGNFEKAFWEGEDVLDEFIQGPPGYGAKLKIVEKLPEESNENEIFIVHGHNEEMKQTVARMIEKINLKAIILHEQPNKGATIIEKFSEYSNVQYAIVLLSADDYGYRKDEMPENARYRARQNVIFELGFFIGKLGRSKVLALYESGKNIEIPSDYSGVVFIPFSNDESWKIPLLKELKTSGFKFDMNKVI